MKSISIALIVMLGLSACGRKGPLQPPPENSAKPADTQPADVSHSSE
ncbi:LPS translocon maturation chaperone LptM [Hydrogenovibrio halophilus]|nr:lipoprotein [Hydrogenovibrio halophilus]